MFTLFDLSKLLGLLVGAIIGASLGWKTFGIVGCIGGAVGGFVSGGLIGQLPLVIALKLLSRKYVNLSAEQLRQQMHDDRCFTPNILLLELRRRGEDVQSELPFVHTLLSSPEMHRRTKGWAALTSAYPELVATIPNYNPTNQTDECCRTSEPLLRYVTEQSGEPERD